MRDRTSKRSYLGGSFIEKVQSVIRLRNLRNQWNMNNNIGYVLGAYLMESGKY